MHAWSGIALSAAALLVWAGVLKLRHPELLVAAWRGVGLTRPGRVSSQLVTVGEIAVGVCALTAGGRWSDAAVAVAYVGFSVFLVVALRRSSPSCGCTGSVDSPPTVAHLLMTTLFAVGSGAAAVNGGVPGVVAVLHDGRPATSLTLLAYVVLVTWFAWAILHVAPRVNNRRTT